MSFNVIPLLEMGYFSRPRPLRRFHHIFGNMRNAHLEHDRRNPGQLVVDTALSGMNKLKSRRPLPLIFTLR